MTEEELIKLKKTYRPGQTWECRSEHSGRWVNTGNNHEPGWFYDTEYRMVKDEHGNPVGEYQTPPVVL